MPQLFVLQNQEKLLLTKQREWSDGRDIKALFRATHRDIALNEMIEVNAKNVSLRIHILECESNNKGLAIIAEEDLPPAFPAEALNDETDNPELDDSLEANKSPDLEPAVDTEFNNDQLAS